MSATELETKIQKVVVFIPAFNEEETIAGAINAVHEAYANSSEQGFIVETLLVDDGCTDKTVEVAREAGVSRIVHHPGNLGLGAATRTGMRISYDMGCDISVKLDADLQHDPLDIEKCIQPILNDEADIVWGSRFSGEIRYKMPLHRYWGNKFFTWLMNVLTDYNITDAQTGLMVFNRHYLSRFQILVNYNPPQQILLDANSKHMRFKEVPVVFNPRTTGESFVSYKYPFIVMAAIFWILIYANPLKVFFSMGAALFSVAIFIASLNVYQYIVGDVDRLFANYGYIILFSLAGLQTLFFGLLADMISRKTHIDR